MTQLICPLCGRFVSLAYFDPTRFDRDIYRVEVTGLGRGKGVKVTGTSSLLNSSDPTIKLIKDRILELTKVLLEHRCAESEEVLSTLQIQTVSPTEVTRRDHTIERLSHDVVVLRTQVKELDKTIKDLSENNETLAQTNRHLQRILKQRDEIIQALTEQTVQFNVTIFWLEYELKRVKQKLRHSAEEAEKSSLIAKKQKTRIMTLEEAVEDLTSALISFNW